ncbi:MAG: plasmid pRiA4b ORF-3 family protein [Chloroflexota bacterium]
MSNPKQVYQLKLTLDRVKPPIWRRLLVKEDINLLTLHEIIQRAMGWDDYHLHMFTIAGQIFGDEEDDEFGDLGTKNEARYKLNKLGLEEKSKFKYEYDFGDSWQHTILVEKIVPSEKGVHYPVCLTGKRACPPEDVGGVWGYENFLKAITDPNHKEHDEYLEWLGGSFDPEEFDLDAVNELLRGIRSASGKHTTYLESEDEEMDELLPTEQEQMAFLAGLTEWMNNLGDELLDKFVSLPLRYDIVTFLDYLSKNPVAGTQSTGNLPLKAVYAICERFVDPPKLEQTIGSHTFKVRSEDEVWELIFVHTLAFHSGLVNGGPGRKWKTTSEGILFPQLAPPIQVVILLVQWIIACDWAIAYPVSGLADGLPDEFKSATLNTLSALPERQNVPFQIFANRVISESGLEWYSQDQSFVQMIKRAVIEQVVIDPMRRFGILECVYQTNESTGHGYRQLNTIQLTAIGKAILTLMNSSSTFDPSSPE